ncbi:holin [Amycolatopsis sp. NPDC021455]|uniref:holin n=1 Tax=Amycolatopsis sp. NPDC021455 TaxID=3154901 RepID=UPI0034045562
MRTRKFWKDAFERAFRTVVQVAIATLAARQTGLLETDWLAALSTVGMAAVLSLLGSVLSQLPNPDGSASFVEVCAPAGPPASTPVAQSGTSARS